jgi:hypothetical protein
VLLIRSKITCTDDLCKFLNTLDSGSGSVSVYFFAGFGIARREEGSREFSAAFPTGGNGSGGTIDSLHSQGSLKLNADHSLLFAVNAGSGTVSSFA